MSDWTTNRRVKIDTGKFEQMRCRWQVAWLIGEEQDGERESAEAESEDRARLASKWR